jgi:hypothetical protein
MRNNNLQQLWKAFIELRTVVLLTTASNSEEVF